MINEITDIVSLWVVLKNATKVKVVKEFNHFIRVKIANCTIIRAVEPAFDGIDSEFLNFGGDEALDVTDSVVTVAAVYIKYNLKQMILNEYFTEISK